jgi:hypothetical protein
MTVTLLLREEAVPSKYNVKITENSISSVDALYNSKKANYLQFIRTRYEKQQ